jgi:hypothetical protein
VVSSCERYTSIIKKMRTRGHMCMLLYFTIPKRYRHRTAKSKTAICQWIETNLGARLFAFIIAVRRGRLLPALFARRTLVQWLIDIFGRAIAVRVSLRRDYYLQDVHTRYA